MITVYLLAIIFFYIIIKTFIQSYYYNINNSTLLYFNFLILSFNMHKIWFYSLIINIVLSVIHLCANLDLNNLFDIIGGILNTIFSPTMAYCSSDGEMASSGNSSIFSPTIAYFSSDVEMASSGYSSSSSDNSGRSSMSDGDEASSGNSSSNSDNSGRSSMSDGDEASSGNSSSNSDNSGRSSMSDGESPVVTTFPVNDLIVIISVDSMSDGADVDGLLELTENITSQQGSLLSDSGTPVHNGIGVGQYELPCTKIRTELVATTNDVIKVLEQADACRLSVAHLGEFLDGFFHEINYLAGLARNSLEKMNYHYNIEYANQQKTFTSCIPAKSVEFAHPQIFAYLYDQNMSSYNKDVMHFYSLTHELSNNVNTQRNLLMEMAISGNSAAFEASDNPRVTLLNIVGNQLCLSSDEIIASRAYAPNIYRDLNNPQININLLENNFIVGRPVFRPN